MPPARKAKSASKNKKRKITPDDLLKLQFIADPQISPDGETILFAKKHVGEKNEYVTNLWAVPAGGGQPRQFTSGGKDGHGRWSPDAQRIAFLSERDEEHPQIYLIPAAGGEATVLTRFPEGAIKSFRWSPDGRSLAVGFRETEAEWTKEAKKGREENGASLPPRVIDDIYYRMDGEGYFNGRRFHLYLVDVASGEHRLLFDRDNIGWFSYDWSPDSKELVVAANTNPDALIKYWKWDLFRIAARSGRSKKLTQLPEGVKSIVAWSPDGKRIAFSGREGKETWGVRNTQLFVCDPDGGGLSNLTGNTDYCLSAATLSDTAAASFDEKFCWSPDGKRLFLNIGWQGETHVAAVPADGGDVTFLTRGRQSVTLGNLSTDGKRLALTVGDQLTPAEAACGECKNNGRGKAKVLIKKLTKFNQPLLDELELSPAEPHWITAADGGKVHLWVMKPAGFRTAKKYPALLLIHGGPHAQYGESFFHEFQVMAAAGYVVVYSNPRGSKGYGEEHCIAIKGEWGNDDWIDIQAVTAFMKDQPYIDTPKLGVAGGSYGGYMTNWVIGHTDDFAAAITDRCVSNLVSMVGSSDLPLVPGEYWEGNSWDKTEEIWEQSPLKHFGNVKTPTLVVHSEGDLRCNVEQGEQVFAALKLRGVPTRFVRYPATTSHGMSRGGPPDLRLHRLGEYLRWWNEYLS